MLVADAHQLLSNRHSCTLDTAGTSLCSDAWHSSQESSSNSAIWALTLLVTFLALAYTARRDLRVFLLLLAKDELPLVATGDKASPESCRTVCEVAMLGEGRRKSGNREVRRGEGRKVKVVNREGK